MNAFPLALGLLLLAAPALAQDRRPAAPAARPAAPAATPAPPAEEERPWQVACGAANQGVRDCVISATVTLRQNNERLARIILRRQPETRSLTIVFQLPHGTWLPGGAAWQVDEAEAQRLPFQTSDAEGLYAGQAVTDDVLGALRRGTTLRLAVVAAATRQVVNIPVPLAKLNEAYTDFTTQERAR